MIKVFFTSLQDMSPLKRLLDMEYEEKRGCSSQEKAQGQRCPNTSAERCVLYTARGLAIDGHCSL